MKYGVAVASPRAAMRSGLRSAGGGLGGADVQSGGKGGGGWWEKGGHGCTVAVGVDERHDAGAEGKAGALDPGQRHMALVVGRRPVQDGKGARAGDAAACCARPGL